MKLTVKWLEGKMACSNAIKEFQSQQKTDSLEVLNILLTKERYNWANWLIVRIMTYSQYVSYAVYAAEQVIEIYETKYPDDNRPRKAIEVAKKCIKNPSEKNKAAAADAAAYAAADADAGAADADAAAYAAAAAAAADAYAAYAAAAAAYAAAYTAYAAAYAAYAAAAAAYAAVATYAKSNMQKKILEHGIELLKEGE